MWQSMKWPWQGPEPKHMLQFSTLSPLDDIQGPLDLLEYMVGCDIITVT
jgi:hypothetical protein